METTSRPIRRRHFLTSGLIGGILFSLGRMKNHAAVSFSESRRSHRCRVSGGVDEKLRKIAAKYGSEFGNLKGRF